MAKLPMLNEAEKVLYDLDKLLEQSTRVDAIFRAYLKGIAKSFKVSRVSLMLLDDARKELFVHEAEGLGAPHKSKARVRLGEGIAGWVAQKGEGVLVQDISRNKRFRKEKKPRGFKSGSFICLPIKVRGKVYGVLNVSEKKSRTPFKSEDLNKLELFGMQLAILVENQKLREEIEWLEQKPVDEIAEVSHDFRIPLTCVQEVLQLMENQDLGPITDSQREFLQLAKRNVKRMIQTFDHLIGIATRVTKSEVRFARTDMAELLEELVANFQARARRKRVRLVVESPSKAVNIKTDAMKTHEVLMNLVDNAIKHTRQGSDVRLRLLTKKNRVRVEVEDKGPGIKSRQKAIIFDKGASVKKSRKEGNRMGHGLGLAISNDIMKMLHGKIGFRTRAGKGSTFYIELPRR